MSNVDTRHIRRGKCLQTDCDCSEYIFNPKQGNKCDYCGEPPAKHENLGESVGTLCEARHVSGQIAERNWRPGNSAQSEEETQFNEEAYQKQLENFMDELQFLCNGEQIFVNKYPKWRIKRLEIIRELQKISHRLKTVQHGTNIATFFGSTLGILGSVLSIVCAVTAITATGGLAIIGVGAGLAVGGGLINTVGAATNSTVKYLDCQKLNEQAKQDEENNKIIIEYVNKAKNCRAMIEEIMDYEKFRHLVETMRLRNRRTVRELHENLKAFIIGNQKRQKLDAFLKICPKLMPILKNVTETGVDPTNTVLAAVRVSSDAIAQTLKIVDAAADTTTLVLHAATTAGKVFAKSTAIGLAAKVVPAGCLVFDATTLALTIKDMNEGSKSKLADEIYKCSLQLEKEMEQLESIYNAINIWRLEAKCQNMLTSF